MTLSDYFVSLIRTAVPVAVGLVLAKLAAATGVTVELGLASEVVTGLAIGGYYAAVRALEAKWRWFGVLLGWKVAPIYGAQLHLPGTRLLRRDGEPSGSHED